MSGTHVNVKKSIRWVNWSGTASATPRRVAAPRSREAVAALVAEARAAGRTVKAVGSGHSFTDVAAADDVLLRMDRYVRRPVIDADAGTVTVSAGTPLHVLNRLLAANSLALPNLGDVDVQTIAGAVSTGTHGTGARLGGLSDFVVGVDLIDGSGRRRRHVRGDPELNATALGLGALGVLTDVTIACVPAFRLHADERPLPLRQVLAEFDALAFDNDHFEFYWFPGAARALVKRNNRAESGPRLPRWRRWVDDELLSNQVFGAMCRLARAAPALSTPVAAAASRALSARSYVDASHRVFCSPRRVKFVEMEYCVPREAFAAAFAGVRRAASRHRVLFPVEVRVSAADPLWLSTAHGRESAYIAVHQYVGASYRDYFDEVEAVMRDCDGRPHWGKMHRRDAADFAQLYPRFDDFRALREELDPDRVFANDYLTRVLGP